MTYLARQDARVVPIVGTGVQAEAQAQALNWWQPDIKIMVHEPLDVHGAQLAQAFCDRLASGGIGCHPAESAEQAARSSDVIVTTTPARQPHVLRDWLRPGVHINAMGADTAGKREHETATLSE